jgi:hypothetical protein
MSEEMDDPAADEWAEACAERERRQGAGGIEKRVVMMDGSDIGMRFRGSADAFAVAERFLALAHLALNQAEAWAFNEGDRDASRHADTPRDCSCAVGTVWRKANARARWGEV